jgi:hypothetical protein
MVFSLPGKKGIMMKSQISAKSVSRLAFAGIALVTAMAFSQQAAAQVVCKHIGNTYTKYYGNSNTSMNQCLIDRQSLMFRGHKVSSCYWGNECPRMPGVYLTYYFY